ncbi:MAG TPA: DUF4440 domain-containing protein, partial [Chitinophagaceae bacterium]|nr:DUF4440 domain-containing protein [Chitinophagaceae bacterium]
MKSLLLFISFWLCGIAQGQTNQELAIKDLLAAQTLAWNQGDLEAFMEG